MVATEVHPGLFASARDVVFLKDDQLTLETDRGVSCGILLEGTCSPIELKDHAPLSFEVEKPLVFGAGRRTTSTSSWKAREHQAFAGFLLLPSFFDRFGSSITDDGLDQLHALCEGEFRAIALPKMRKLSMLARQLLDQPYSAQLNGLYVESNTLAFVVGVAESLGSMSRIVEAIGRRQYERVMDAVGILEDNIASPPTTLGLARQVGINVSTLQRHFRAAFGIGIFGYVRRLRLEQARSLLLNTDLPVGEVGHQVGFASHAAFSAAYRRQFGDTPSRDSGRLG